MKEYYEILEDVDSKDIIKFSHNGRKYSARDCAMIMNNLRNVNDMLSQKIAEKDKQIAELKAENEFMQNQIKYHTNKILNFKKQLKEKDEEIERWRCTTVSIERFEDAIDEYEQQIKANTHQVCEKIEPIVLRCAKYKGFDYIEFKKLLDQLEKGVAEK